MQAKGLAILGGSFNPPHIGHLRLAIEISEILSDELERVLLVPCAHPPHKALKMMLPFDLRCEMLEACLDSLPKVKLSRIEGERSTPSYTFETLKVCQKLYPGQPLYFILGSDDYAQLGTWYRGLELPKLCHLLVVNRGDYSYAEFCSTTKTLWPEAQILADSKRAFKLPLGGQSFLIKVSSIEVSSTELRRRWEKGLSLNFLVPEEVLRLLSIHASSVTKAWSAC